MVPPTPPIGLAAPAMNIVASVPHAPVPQQGPQLSPAAGTIALPPQAAPVHAPPPVAHADFAAAPRAHLAATLIDVTPPVMDAPVPSAAPPIPVRAPAPTAGRRPCSVCATENDASLRYCESCGTTLQKPPPPPMPAAAAAPVASMNVATAAAPPPIAMPISGAIQPERVVDIGGAQSAPTESARVCSRCRGTCESTAQFCRFCGSSLADAQPVPSSSLVSETPADRRKPLPVPAAQEPASARRPPSPVPPPLPAAAVAPQRARGRLVVVAKDGGEGPSFPLLDQVDIGRSEGNVVIAEDRYLAPRHGRLVRRNGRLFLRDLGSPNGIYVRLSRAKEARGTDATEEAPQTPELEVTLRDQDLFLVGQQVIRFEIVRDAEEGLGPAVEHGTLLFGTPTSPRYARLCQRTTEGVTRDVYYLSKRETVLGRESGDIVFTEDPFLSRRHAIVRASELSHKASFSLVDLGSSNGTFIQIRGEVPLKDGDQFRIGQQLFRVDLSQDAPSHNPTPAHGL